MLGLVPSSHFVRDLKACRKKRWNMKAMQETLDALSMSDEQPLDPKYKDHSLKGDLKGKRSLHVPSAPNPPSGTWVLAYEIDGDNVYLARTGTHDEVYGKSNI